jgi:hypothetical protein
MAGDMMFGAMESEKKRYHVIPRLTKNLRERFCDVSQGRTDMRFYGKVYKDGKFWLAEVPILETMTQGRTKKEAFVMVEDLLETLVNRPGFSVTVHPGKHGDFEVSSTDTRGMISLLLRRQRERSGLSLAQAAERLGAKSRNAYARYERGTSVPTLEKLNELLQAVAPDQDLVLHHSVVA